MPRKIFKSRLFRLYAGIVAAFIVLGICGHFIIVDADVKNNRPEDAVQSAHSEKAYYNLPSIMVDMNSDSGSSRVQVDVSLEIPRKDMRVLAGYQPRIMDRLNMYLSHTLAEKLTHQDSLARIRGEMLKEVNNVGAPVMVSALILQKIIVM